MNVLLAGEESACVQILQAVTQRGYNLSAVLASPGGRAWKAAEKLACRTLRGSHVTDPQFASTIRAEEIDILLNVHSLYIIHPEILQAPRISCFNMHPGPLPRYAGLNGVSWAIYHDERQHGVTVHKMLPEIDTGPIAYQTLFDVSDRHTPLDLMANCVQAGRELVLELLAAASHSPEDIPLREQDLTKRTYFGREVPHDGRLSWSWPARKVYNFVRACDYYPFPSPWGHPTTECDQQELAVLKASLTGEPCNETPGSVGEPEKGGIKVACADEWMRVHRVMIEGRKVKAGEILKKGERLSDG